MQGGTGIRVLLIAGFFSLFRLAWASAEYPMAPLRPATGMRLGIQLCTKYSLECDPGKTSMYRLGNLLYLIDNSKPQIAIFRPAGQGLPMLTHRLDAGSLTEIASSRQPDRETYIQPVIYGPTAALAAKNPVVAVVSARTESFSGGGRSQAMASFVEVPEYGSQKKPALVYSSIPFHCFEMIRACFSARDYKTSPHCHDETEGILRVKRIARRNGQPDWHMMWQETRWAAHKGKKHQTVRQYRLTEPPFSSTALSCKVP